MTELFIKGPVLSPGATGWPGQPQDRPLTAEEIQKAAYQFLPGYSIIDVQHSFRKQADIVESYIAPEITRFNDNDYPAGTWFITARISDETIIKAVNDGELTGLSVGAFPEKQYEDLKRPIVKGMFSDVEEGAWFSLAISIVDVPFYPEMVFKVFGPDDFIKKNKQNLEDEFMSEDKTRDTLLEKVFDFLIKKEEAEAIPEDEPVFITKDELDEALDKILKEIKPVETVEDEAEAEEAEEEVVEEETETVEDEPEPEPSEPITKALPQDQPPVIKKSFNEQIGRDSFGNKI
jgi:hypothetical protein